MADSAQSSSNRPVKAAPEVISTPSKNIAGVQEVVDPPKQDPASVNAALTATPNASFSNTNQHVADRQKATVVTERFTNTKQNIALINDPKNGPRFTLTKKESGLVEKAGAPKTKPDQGHSGGHAEAKAKGDVNPPTAALASSTVKPLSGMPEGGVDGGTDAKIPETALPKARPLGPLGVPPATEAPSKVPVDSSKTFVGPNGTYYDEAWRWMDWRGTKRSWNWPAALTFGHWFAYRRLYWQSAVYLGWLTALVVALVNNLHVGLVAGLLVSTLVLSGYYANTLYFQVFRRAVAHVTEKGEGSYDDLQQQLAHAGGVSPKAPWFMGIALAIGIGLALLATFYGRGGLLINLWPF